MLTSSIGTASESILLVGPDGNFGAPVIIQLVAGVIGGNAAGRALKDYDLGALGNSVAGAIGGAGGGQLLAGVDPCAGGCRRRRT